MLLREPLPAVAFAVFAPRPAAGPALALLELLLGPPNAARAGGVLLCILDPADELVAGQGRDVLPGIECRGVDDQRISQVRGQFMHHPTGHSLAAHMPIVLSRRYHRLRLRGDQSAPLTSANPIAAGRFTRHSPRIAGRWREPGDLLRRVRSIPQAAEDCCRALGFDPVWRVEVVAFLEHLKREVVEDLARPLGFPTIVVGVAPATEHEQDGSGECTQSIQIEARGQEGLEERPQTRWPSGHPWRRRAGWPGRRLDAGSQLIRDAPAAVAAARAAGQAASIPHMGAHALGAAAYAAKAAGLAAPERPEAVSEEIRWQLGHMTAAARAALRQLPPVGENSSGPLGPGLLASGLLGTIVRDLQASLADSDSSPPRPQADQNDGKREEQPVEVHATERLA
jgi:hypothetical protein